MAPALPWIATAIGAIGAGIQYVSSSAAADTQAQLALLNAQAQTQAIEQQGQVNQMQAAINAELARKDQDAANANADAYAAQAELQSAASRDATRRSREESARLAAAGRTAIGKGNLSDATASPLAYLAKEAFESQEKADAQRLEDENNRRALFREAYLAKNQGILAGINATGHDAAGLAAAQAAKLNAAKVQLDSYEQLASASAARTTALGSLFNQFGSLGFNLNNTWKNQPRTPTSPAPKTGALYSA